MPVFLINSRSFESKYRVQTRDLTTKLKIVFFNTYRKRSFIFTVKTLIFSILKDIQNILTVLLNLQIKYQRK